MPLSDIPKAVRGRIISAKSTNKLRAATGKDVHGPRAWSSEVANLHSLPAEDYPPTLFELTEDILHPNDPTASADWSVVHPNTEMPDVRFVLNAIRVLHNIGDNSYGTEEANVSETLYESGSKGLTIFGGGGGAVVPPTTVFAQRYYKGMRILCLWNEQSQRWEFNPPWEDFGATVYRSAAMPVNLSPSNTPDQIELNNNGEMYGQDTVQFTNFLLLTSQGILNNSGRSVTGLLHYSASVERVVDGTAPRDAQAEVYCENDGTIIPGTIGRLSSTTVATGGAGNVVSGSVIVTLEHSKYLTLWYRYVTGGAPVTPQEWNVRPSGCHLTFEAKRW